MDTSKIKIKRMKVSDVLRQTMSADKKRHQEKFKTNLYDVHQDTMSVSNIKTPLTFTQFEKLLKQLDPYFFIGFNFNIPTPDRPQGHAIRYRDLSQIPLLYHPVCGVGKASEKLIPAQTQFEEYYDKNKNIWDKRATNVGWVGVYQRCKEFLKSLKRERELGISY